jgi:PAS domain S-box-containing protein
VGRLGAPLVRAFQDESVSIEQRLFRGLTLVTGLLAILVVVPLNYPQRLPAFVNLSVCGFGLLALGLYRATFQGYYGMKLLFFIHVGNLDLIWFGNAGSQGSVGMFFFAAAMYLVIFFKGSTRWWLLGLDLANWVALLTVEHLHPKWVWPFPNPEARLLDLVTGFMLSTLVCVLILWVVLSAYHRERERLGASLVALGASEDRFRSLVMNAPIPLCVANLDGRLDYVNRSFVETLGYSEKDLPDLGACWEKVCPEPEQQALALLQWRQVSAQPSAQGAFVPPTEYVVACKDGRRLPLEVQAALIGDQCLVMLTDLSERRRNEAAMRQSQKLESLGVLAGGIAHDFNNLLSAMQGNLNLAQMNLAPGAASSPYLEHLDDTIRKAAGLTRQMLAYSGKGRFVVEPLSLNHLVAEITDLLTVSISKKVRLDYNLASSLPVIEADPAQVQQVVMNLVTNASEAIGEDSGAITIETSLRRIEEPETQTVFSGQPVEPGDYVTLRVADTGCGMEPGVLARIFDPFFSTKSSGRGLGLSAMLGILRGHGAAIEIRSEAGQGSDFQVHFPASRAGLPAVGGTVPTKRMGRFQGKVLLADDEADLRLSFRDILEHLGFEVVSAQDGLEAVELFQPGEFALVLMDLTMPRLDGREAFLQMRALDPEVKVILISGYSEQEAIDSKQALRPAAFIQKPFSLQILESVLERVLG